MALVQLYPTPDELMALSVRDLLLQNGIGALYRRDDALAGLQVMTIQFGEILVEEADLERAEELLGGFLGTLGMLTEA
jgi:hypothetical protein